MISISLNGYLRSISVKHAVRRNYIFADTGIEKFRIQFDEGRRFKRSIMVTLKLPSECKCQRIQNNPQNCTPNQNRGEQTPDITLSSPNQENANGDSDRHSQKQDVPQIPEAVRPMIEKIIFMDIVVPQPYKIIKNVLDIRGPDEDETQSYEAKFSSPTASGHPRHGKTARRNL